jgi:hypothetical protein
VRAANSLIVGGGFSPSKTKARFFNYFSDSFSHQKVCAGGGDVEEFSHRCQNPPPSAASSLRIILHLLFTGVLTFLWDEQDLKLFSLLIVAVF